MASMILDTNGKSLQFLLEAMAKWSPITEIKNFLVIRFFQHFFIMLTFLKINILLKVYLKTMRQSCSTSQKGTLRYSHAAKRLNDNSSNYITVCVSPLLAITVCRECLIHSVWFWGKCCKNSKFLQTASRAKLLVPYERVMYG